MRRRAGNREERQARAIAALLLAPTVASAARDARVPRRTLYSWRREPAFRQALAEARTRLVEVAVARACSVLGRTITDLLAQGHDPDVPPGVRTDALIRVLDLALHRPDHPAAVESDGDGWDDSLTPPIEHAERLQSVSGTGPERVIETHHARERGRARTP